MEERPVTIPELALFAGTRGIICFGAGLLASAVLGDKVRRSAGIALVVGGLLTAIPMGIMLFNRERAAPPRREVDSTQAELDFGANPRSVETAKKLSPDGRLA